MPSYKPYSIARAELVAEQVGRFATQHVHQLAGHNANLAFWIGEAVAAVRTLDEYQQRFKALESAQLAWVRDHHTKISGYCPMCRGACEFGPQTPPRPVRLPSEELEAARASIRRSVRRFLVRLYHAGFITEPQLREHADAVGVPVEPEDLTREEDARQ